MEVKVNGMGAIPKSVWDYRTMLVVVGVLHSDYGPKMQRGP
jgi:hypothetical protein